MVTPALSVVSDKTSKAQNSRWNANSPAFYPDYTCDLRIDRCPTSTLAMNDIRPSGLHAYEDTMPPLTDPLSRTSRSYSIEFSRGGSGRPIIPSSGGL